MANVNGAVIVVANRNSPAQQAMAAQQMSHLVEIVRRSEPERLAYAFSQLARSATWSRDLAEVGIVMPTPQAWRSSYAAVSPWHSTTARESR